MLLTLTGVILVWQLFLPPIIGLADQGDFLKLLGPLGYAPVPKGPEHKYWYVTRQYVRDPSYREPRWEQVTSELLIARAAVAIHNLIGNPERFDITLFGFIHAVLFLLALARLLYVTKDLPMYGIIWGLVFLALTDVGYVAYWNSLYTEPASCLWFLFFLAESISICASDQLSLGPVLRWNVFAALWITAKTQNAALCVPLAVYGLVMIGRTRDSKIRFAASAGAVSICLAGVMMYRSLLPAPRVMVRYDVIFEGILPQSPDPRADLKALGLNPDYAQYSGTLPWSEHTGVADGALVNALLARTNSFQLMAFYLKRPARMWRRLHAVLPAALSLRPEFCGNFDQSAGRHPGARSNAVALWSHFHEYWLAPIAPFLLGSLCLVIVGGSSVLLFGKGHGTGVQRYLGLAICLATCCLIAFGVAAFGDAWDNVKHEFLFNLLLDTCLAFGAVGCIALFVDKRRTADSVPGAAMYQRLG